MHIGLIGGIGPAATVFYYERLVRAFAGSAHSLNLTIAHANIQTLARNASAGLADEQAADYYRLTKQLAAAGADVVVISSMGGHFCATEFAALSPLPIIHGPESVANYLVQQGIRRIGVLGTRSVMNTGLYGALNNLEPIIPLGEQLNQVNDDYVAMAIAGVAEPDGRERLLAAGKSLVRDQGAQAVLLGGTDLSLAYGGATLDFPVIDSAAVHVDAIIDAVMDHSGSITPQ